MSWGARRKAVRQQPTDVEAFDPEVVAEVRELFNKVRTYVKPDPILLQTLKTSLNEVKNRLSDKDLEVWHQHTNSTNRAGKVIGTVRTAANAEICTQAWCTFYEILGTFNLLVFHCRSEPLPQLASTRATGTGVGQPTHSTPITRPTEGAPPPQTTASLPTRWFFGSDNTGDIMRQRHLLELQGFVGNMLSIDVVTRWIRESPAPDEQEALVASLHYCEAVAALFLLGPGGLFVLKMFTLYEHSSLCLLYLLYCCLRSVSVFKPGTSKEGNSEVYVVCLHYDGRKAVRPLLSKLICHFWPDLAAREALFPSQLLPQSFLAQHEQACSYFHALQTGTIGENLKLFEGLNEKQRQRLENIRDCTAHEYLQRFQVRVANAGELALEFRSEPSLPPTACTTLHDGEPQYQRDLLCCVLLSLHYMGPGDALLLPLCTFTRVTAATIHCLHLSFRSITLRCPSPPGAAGGVLVCDTDILPPVGQRQVLQFVPMELLKGELTEFLWTMNSAIVHQWLHLLMEA
uniref:Cap-specific mRNA (nucleoside-2'-O-)-methyltransferase 2 n=1 Tax=Oncorhynchus kisutch TaxID=8019 RepID=A0A8C7GYF8_ONCKI